MYMMLLWSFPLLEESIVLLFQAAVGWESSFLQCCYVNVEPLELSANVAHAEDPDNLYK